MRKKMKIHMNIHMLIFIYIAYNDLNVQLNIFLIIRGNK